MRRLLSTILTPIVMFGFTGTAAAEKPKVQLSDEGLPLQEIRPLDRRSYILTLEGKWLRPALPGKSYYVNIFFPDGGIASHRVLKDGLFAQGEVRVILQGYELIRHDVSRGGRLSIAISMDRAVLSTKAEEVISDPLEVSWPMDRPVILQPARGRHSPPEPVDVFPRPEDVRPPEIVPVPRPVPPVPSKG